MSETDLETNMDELIQPSSRSNKNKRKKNVFRVQREKLDYENSEENFLLLRNLKRWKKTENEMKFG